MFRDRVITVYIRDVIVISTIISLRSPNRLIVDINTEGSPAVYRGNCYARQDQSIKQENELRLFHIGHPFMATGERKPFHETFNSYSDWKRRLERLDNVG
jgi:hypothetical protein